VVLGDMARDLGGRVGVGEIGGDPRRRNGQRPGEAAQALLATRHEDQLRAGLASEAPGGCLADAARRSGNDGDERHERQSRTTSRPWARAPQPEVLAREAKAERAARTQALVITLGAGADVELQPSRALQGITQEP
jgi:hypothetical protein